MSLNYLGQTIVRAVATFIRTTAPALPFVGVAIGEAIDGGLMSLVHPGRSGADQLWQQAPSPHLGSNIDIMS